MISKQQQHLKSKVLLNLGCGQTRPSNWINTDCSVNSLLQQNLFSRFLLKNILKRTAYEQNNCHFMDLNKKWNISSNSVDIVYSSHVLEHLSLTSAKVFFRRSLSNIET